jgi:hypothetical protein
VAAARALAIDEKVEEGVLTSLARLLEHDAISTKAFFVEV